jgi:hypothetical protein
MGEEKKLMDSGRESVWGLWLVVVMDVVMLLVMMMMVVDTGSSK